MRRGWKKPPCKAFLARLILGLAALGLPAPSEAQDVTLTAPDGTVVIEGRLLGFDGEFFRLDTEFGELTVDGRDLGCAGAACPDPAAFVARLAISGAASAGRSLLPPLIETFAARNGYELARSSSGGGELGFEISDPEAGRRVGLFTLHLGTSAEGFADLVADEADLALSVREITRAEATLAREAGRGDVTAPGRSRILGLDGLVPIVSVATPLAELAFDDLRRLASGEITDWSGLGGKAAPLTLHLPAPGSGLTEALLDRLSLSDDALAPAAVHHDDAAALAAAVDADPRALGVTSFAAIGNAQPVAIRGPCGIVSEATVSTLKTEDYPLTTPIFVYTPARRMPALVRAFLDYATSPAAQPVIRRAGYVDQFPEAIAVAAQGDRLLNAILKSGEEVALGDLRRMGAAMAGRARLSISFRFEDGSSTLDAQSRSNVALLAEALERGVFDGRALTFMGFSDAQGPAGTNRRLARSRARAVRGAVEAAAGPDAAARLELEIAAFGETMPMACDDVDWGRRVNRRVEVWLD